MIDFLSCEWRKLAVANFQVNPSLLAKYLPYKTELDLYDNSCYVSLVGFMFFETRVLGMKIPYHVNFEELNLRFYVRHRDKTNEWKRGVVFIKEIVPKPAIALVARWLYSENYEFMPMRHQWTVFGNSLEVEYAWKQTRWNDLHVRSKETPRPIQPASEEQFILEHYWGYTRVKNNKTFEYHVEHPAWHVYPVTEYNIDVDFGSLYGHEFDFLKNEKPKSVFLAEGSDVKVKSKRIL